jgi:hypothetical protein
MPPVAAIISVLTILLCLAHQTSAFCATCTERDFAVAYEQFTGLGSSDCSSNDDTLGWYSNDGDTVAAYTGYDEVTGHVLYSEMTMTGVSVSDNLNFTDVKWCNSSSCAAVATVECGICSATATGSEQYICYGPRDCSDFDDGGCSGKLAMGFLIMLLIPVVICCGVGFLMCYCCRRCGSNKTAHQAKASNGGQK